MLRLELKVSSWTLRVKGVGWKSQVRLIRTAVACYCRGGDLW